MAMSIPFLTSSSVALLVTDVLGRGHFHTGLFILSSAIICPIISIGLTLLIPSKILGEHCTNGSSSRKFTRSIEILLIVPFCIVFALNFLEKYPSLYRRTIVSVNSRNGLLSISISIQQYTDNCRHYRQLTSLNCRQYRLLIEMVRT